MGTACGRARAVQVRGLQGRSGPLAPGREFQVGSSSPALVRPWPGTRKSLAVRTANVCLQMPFY